MGILFIWISVFPILAGIAAYFVSKVARKKLEMAGNRHVRLISVITFIFSFVLIFVTMSALLFYNVQFRR